MKKLWEIIQIIITILFSMAILPFAIIWYAVMASYDGIREKLNR